MNYSGIRSFASRSWYLARLVAVAFIVQQQG